MGFVEEAQAKVAQQLKLPQGYRIVWGGQFENQQRAAARLALVIPLALGAIFLLLMLTFRSVRQATLVIANIPFALVGGIAALRLSGAYLSVPASVGFIALLGIAVLHGVVLVSHFNALLESGLSMAETVRTGVATNTNIAPPGGSGDISGALAVAANARVALFDGGQYLLARLDPATPTDLAGEVSRFANQLMDIGAAATAGVPNSDPVQAGRLQDAEAASTAISGRCR